MQEVSSVGYKQPSSLESGYDDLVQEVSSVGYRQRSLSKSVYDNLAKYFDYPAELGSCETAMERATLKCPISHQPIKE